DRRMGKERDMSQFVYLYRSEPASRTQAMSPERAQQSMQRWMKWMQELESKGHLKDRGQPLENGGKVVRGQQKTVTDGPYAEANDHVGRISLVEAQSIEQAVAPARCCPILAGGGSVEVRPVMKMDF